MKMKATLAWASNGSGKFANDIEGYAAEFRYPPATPD